MEISVLRDKLKQSQLERLAIEKKLRDSENLNLGLIAENNKLHAILRTRGKGDANQEATA